MNYHEEVKDYIEEYPELKLIDAAKLYEEKFSFIPETAYYKAISRLAKSGLIERMNKGIYYRPQVSKFGTVSTTVIEIMNSYMGKKQNRGVVVGDRMYHKHGLTPHRATDIVMYSAVLKSETRTIDKVYIKRANLRFDPLTVQMIELLEVLQWHHKIADLDIKNFVHFLEEAGKAYDEATVNRVLKVIKYKKSTIASLERLLNFYRIENNLASHLNKTSRYKTIDIENVYREMIRASYRRPYDEDEFE